MRVLILSLLLVAGIASLGVGCDEVNKLTSTRIGTLLENPRDYEGKEVTVFGTVTDASSLVLFKYFEIQDETGAIKVVTERLLPGKGEKLTVKGRMEVFELGSERFVALRESAEPDDRAGNSSDRDR